MSLSNTQSIDKWRLMVDRERGTIDIEYANTASDTDKIRAN